MNYKKFKAIIKRVILKTPSLLYLNYLRCNGIRTVLRLGRVYLRSPRIENIMIEPTNACNLECYMCNAKGAKRQRGFMDMGVCQRVLEEARRERVKNLVLHTVGESLIHPNIIEMIKMAKLGGFTVRLSSNGMLLNYKMSKMLIESGLDQFRFSIEGAAKETYERIRQGADFDILLENIKVFKKLRDEYGRKPNITISSLIMKETESEVEKFYKIFSPFSDSIEFAFLGNQAGQISSVFNSSSTRNIEKRNRYPCKLLWTTVIVLWNGDVSVCCVDFDGKLIVGNIKEQPLRDIWTSEKYNFYRNLHKNLEQKSIQMCKDCSVTWEPANGYSLYKMNKNLEMAYHRV